MLEQRTRHEDYKILVRSAKLTHQHHQYTVADYTLNFTARAYARAVLGVVILSVCLSVTRVDCDKTK